MFILSPGYIHTVDFVTAATQARETRREAVRKDIEERSKNKVPESEDTDYETIALVLDEAVKAAKAGDDTAVHELATKAINSVTPSRELPPKYVASEGESELSVQIKLLSRAEWNDLNLATVMGFTEGDWKPCLTLVEKCVVAVRGFDLSGVQISDVELWDHADIIGTLYAIVREYHELGHKEKKLFGLRPL